MSHDCSSLILILLVIWDRELGCFEFVALDGLFCPSYFARNVFRSGSNSCEAGFLQSLAACSGQRAALAPFLLVTKETFLVSYGSSIRPFLTL